MSRRQTSKTSKSGPRTKTDGSARNEVHPPSAPPRTRSQAEADAAFARGLQALKQQKEIKSGRVFHERIRSSQREWLERLRDQMEAELCALELPRDCWRELSFPQLLDKEEIDPFKTTTISWPPLGTTSELRDFLQKLDREYVGERTAAERCQTADEAERRRDYAVKTGRLVARTFWGAAIAWAADYALSTRDPDVRFRLGRYLEAFQILREYPEIESASLRRAFQRRGKEGQSKVRKGVEPLWEFIRQEHQKLVRAGYTRYGAAEAIAFDQIIQKRIEEEAIRLYREGRGRNLLPWRGKFYSLSRIRQIVGM